MDQKTVLIVEDEQPLLKALSAKLDAEGFRTLQAENGEEGLAIILREHPDITLLDIFMPKMDGLATLQEIRKDEWGKTAKVVMLTNSNDPTDIAQAVDVKADAYLTKADTKLEDVAKKIREVLGST